ncbi:hypothetical protein M011DRAFT_470578 [Sporormia fimetaria CBS 119925]|uniref:Uncharacterized protein n=1 Tax=Sporormia fimetaria CBS 119925 TaxID=1340428 RepID=A0A6A6V551_9PLEO|nr:hypothetical protein M011DRAFT_470578 [Sporormia fimetaria CBS 119925]
MAILSPIIHLLSSPSTPPRPNTRSYILYFIPGNPGLIEYYREFLTHLFSLLQEVSRNSSQQPLDFEIYGRSLPGFETSAQEKLEDASRGETEKPAHDPPYSLAEQIETSEKTLKRIVREARKSGKRDVRVVVMGHSFGTYVCMELMRRLRARDVLDDEDDVRIVGGVMLFPAIMNIAGSPQGVKATRFATSASFPRLAQAFVHLLVALIPASVLSFFIRFGAPPHAAQVVAAFIKSPTGVQQALYLLQHELREITLDKWDEEIWGAAHKSTHRHPRPVLRFLFAKKDHWVAQETRDELIATRAAKGEGETWKPKMEVDEVNGWPHAFCIKHSIPVAERVKEYLEDIIEADLKS